MNPFWKVFLFALIPVATMIVGGAVAVWRPPNAKWRSAILHFAAGVVFSVVAVELLPDVVSRHRPLEVAIGFGLGVAVPLGIRSLTARKAEKQAETDAKSASTGLLFGVGVDIVIDGLLLGIGFAAGAKEGVLLTLALATELLSLGLATAAALGAAGVSRARNLGTIAGLALLFLVGASAGATLLRSLSDEWLELVLSFAWPRFYF